MNTGRLEPLPFLRQLAGFRRTISEVAVLGVFFYWYATALSDVKINDPFASVVHALITVVLFCSATIGAVMVLCKVIWILIIDPFIRCSECNQARHPVKIEFKLHEAREKRCGTCYHEL